MADAIRLDLHLHSSFSDGSLGPEALAAALSASGVKCASLCDHDSLEGLEPFAAACSKLGIATVPGLELSVFDGRRELHVLAHGINPGDQAIGEAVSRSRRLRSASMRRLPSERFLSVEEAVDLIHKAGGLASLAHPHALSLEPSELDELLTRLARSGIDGVELFFPGVGEPPLLRRARELGLLVCSGSDFHGPGCPGPAAPGVDMPAELWRGFRDALLKSKSAAERPRLEDLPGGEAAALPPRPRWRSFALGMAIPAAMAVALAIGALLWVSASFEELLLDQKRETIRELTRAACGILEDAHKEAASGAMSLSDAQAAAKRRVASMRYGKEGKDYFWIQDSSPRMLMHPYRPDLEGMYLGGYRDRKGERIFQAFAKLAIERKEGYVDYVWQWMDDPGRFEPKESYVRLFEPWGWIVGTGLYINDVKEETGRIREGMLKISMLILVCVGALIAHILRGAARLEGMRAQAEMRLWESGRRYRSLAQAATEGVIYVRRGRLSYANSVALELAGCGADALPLLELDELFPDSEPGNASLNRRVSGLAAGEAHAAEDLPCVMRQRSGAGLPCRATIRRLPGDQDGLMLLLRRSGMDPEESPARVPGASHAMRRLLRLPAAEDMELDIAGAVSRAASIGEIAGLCRGAPSVVCALLENGLPPGSICHMLASVTDAAASRTIEIAMAEMPPPPCPFALIALGSQGRQEQTLLTDQDNAIIFDAPGGGAGEKAACDYFVELGARVCEGLAAAGYMPCNGGIMASNPRWVRPLESWKRQFDHWILRADECELMEFSIFFDFRAVYGEKALARKLRLHAHETLARSPRFFPLAAQHALKFKAPRRIFGKIIQPDPDKKSPHGHLDLKAASIPIVSFARVYALRHCRHETGTMWRLDSLARDGVMLESKANEAITAYEVLLRLRLKRQAAALRDGRQPDNLVDVNALGHIERAMLSECFGEIDSLQARVRHDFLGGEHSSF